MAITSVALIDQSAKEALTGGRRVRTYTSTYKLKSNTRFEDPNTVRTAAGIPALASSWPSDLGAVCVNRDVKRAEEADAWLVTCEFTSNPDIRVPPDEAAEENPLLRPAVIDRGPQQRQRIVTRDINGDWILNTAFEFLNPPVEREEHSPSFSVTKNMANWPTAVELAYADSINNAVVSIPSKGIAYGVGVGKFNGFSGRENYENGYHFWTVTMDIETDWQGWNKPIVNAGYNELVTDGITEWIVPIILANGERPSSPVLLTNAGVADPDLDPPIELPYKKYRETDHMTLFALFGLV
jgi:hypothetical protein